MYGGDDAGLDVAEIDVVGTDFGQGNAHSSNFSLRLGFRTRSSSFRWTVKGWSGDPLWSSTGSSTMGLCTVLSSSGSIHSSMSKPTYNVHSPRS